LPEEVRDISFRYAQKICDAPHSVVSTVPIEAMCVGMIGGKPIAYAWDRPIYLDVVNIVKSKKSIESKLIELLKISGRIV